MFFHQVLDTLKREGFRVTLGAVRYAVEAGKISPVGLDAVGNRRFDERHLAELRQYLASPRRPGRKKDRRQEAGVS